MRFALKVAALLAFTFAMGGAVQASPVWQFADGRWPAPPVTRHVRAIRAVLDSNLNDDTQYIGTVSTFRGFIGSFLTSVTYNTDDKLFYLLEGDQFKQLHPDGTAKLIATLNTSGDSLVWDHATQLFYVCAPQSYEVLSISPSGAVNLLAGGHLGTGDGIGASAQFQYPTGMTLDPVNDVLYVADNDRLRRVGVDGSVLTVGGSGKLNAAGFPNVYNLAFDTNTAEVAITNFQPDEIGAYSTLTQTYREIAGRCVNVLSQFDYCAFLQQDGHGSSAFFALTDGIAYSGVTDDYYVVDAGNAEIRRVSPSGDVTTIAGNGGQGLRDGIGYLAEFSNPTCTAFDPDTNALLVCDHGGGSLRNVTTTGVLPLPLPHSFAMTLTPSPFSGASSIVSAPDGSFWFTEGSAGYLAQRLTNGKIRQYALPGGYSDPYEMMIGSNGDVVFGDLSGPQSATKSYIARRSSSGQITETPFPQHCGYGFYDYPSHLTAGPNGTTWFAGFCPSSLGFLTSTGQYDEIPTQQIGGIAIGLGPYVWAGTYNGLLKFNTDGSYVATYANVSADSGVAIGADGNIWFANSSLSEIGMFNPKTKTVVTYSLPPCGCNSRDLGHLVARPSGDLWFTEGYTGFDGYPTAIGRMTESGVYTEFPIFEPRSGPSGIAFSSNGTLWISDAGANKIGHMR